MPGYGIDDRIDTSPDGRNLYASFGDLPPVITRYEFPVATGPARHLPAPSVSYFTEMSVSPDGKLVAYKVQDEYVGERNNLYDLE